MGNRLYGRVALVNGSSRGIGAAIARLFASEGATVKDVARAALFLSSREDSGWMTVETTDLHGGAQIQ